jgi:hypothetical protein
MRFLRRCAWLLVLLPVVPSPLAAAEGGPLVVDRPEHHFGVAAQEQELEASVTYRNAGEGPVTGIRAIGDCGCYGVTLSATELEPGAEGTLKVTFQTLMMSGTVKKKLRLLADSHPDASAVVQLVVDVVGGVVISPGRVWFGDVLKGEAPEKSLVAKWHKESGKPFTLLGVEVPGQDLAITTKPYETPEWKGTTVTFAFRSPPPLGMLSATALVRTDHPDFPRIKVPLSANVTGRVWVQSRTVYFGWIQKGTEKSTTILVRPYAPGVDLGEVSARSVNGVVKAAIAPDPRDEKGWWRLVVTVPAETPVGRFEDVVELVTAVEGEEVTALPVSGEVLDVGR